MLGSLNLAWDGRFKLELFRTKILQADFPKWLEDGKKAFFAADTSPGSQNWIMQLMLTTPLRVIVAIIPALIWRLLDEEKFLARNLPGYVEYQHRVRYRLIPLVW